MTRCIYNVDVCEFIDFDGRPILKKFQCTNEKDHVGDHLIVVRDNWETEDRTNECSHNGGVYHDESPDGLTYMACCDCHQTLDDDYE